MTERDLREVERWGHKRIIQGKEVQVYLNHDTEQGGLFGRLWPF